MNRWQRIVNKRTVFEHWQYCVTFGAQRSRFKIYPCIMFSNHYGENDMEDFCPWLKGYSPTQPTLGDPSFHIFPYKNVKNHLHEKQKVVLVRRVTCPAVSPFCDGKVILLSRPTFLHINTLVLDNQSMREQCWTGQRRQPFSHINTYLSWLGWDGQPSTQKKSSLYMTCITYLSW